ncbi:MAG: tetratricopeptide repeat protein, partial [Ferruginibacter sp.]
DNMYLLIGKAYFYRNEMDSAALTFQFINYNLFPRKKKEDDNRIVGTNDAPGTGNLSIANKEKQNVFQKVISLPPSRNDALIWLARTFTVQEAFGDAAGLINILQNDQNLPKRLKNDLEEVTAFWFFKQNNYDSAAAHLAEALTASDNKQDQSRWEFLLGQLYEMNGEYQKSSEYYVNASKHTIDPVLEINARLNDAKMLREGADPKQLDKSINNLLEMAKKDRYENYRDIIYYSAAQIAIKKPDTTNTIAYLLNATSFGNPTNLSYKNKSFFQLGNLSYDLGDFKSANSYYDSLQLAATDDFVDVKELNERKVGLAKLVLKIENIEREDSLQLIAALSPAERDAYIKKLVKKLRKEKGVKEDDNNDRSAPITFGNDKNIVTDLFDNNSKGEWYFYNNSLRGKGFAEFGRKWGKRTNEDNWRRKSTSPIKIGLSTGGDPFAPNPTTIDSVATINDINFDALMDNLPLSAEELDSSNAIICLNMFEKGEIFKNDLQEYYAAIFEYEAYLERFPSHVNQADAYIGLYYCYTKIGNTARANYYKNQLTSKHRGSMQAMMIENPALLNPNEKNLEVTARYESIYNMFIEGDFTAAMAEKKKADSIHSTNYWTPQLLYIEAVYHIKENNDSTAIACLNNLQTLYPQSPLTPKAAILAEVLGRRKEIEAYLNSLQVIREEEDIIIVADEKEPLKKTTTASPVAIVPPVKVQPIIKQPSRRDSSAAIKPIAMAAGFAIQPEIAHYVVMLLDRVDGVYINEAKNAVIRFNKESMATSKLIINRDTLDAARTMFLLTSFTDAPSAIAYMDKLKKAAPREMSWLPNNKYSFFVISENNLQLLKTNKDLEGYRKLLNESLGNKF